MRQRRGTIWTERALMVLFLASLAGALNLVMAVHRRAAATRREAEAVSTPSVQVDTAATNVPASAPRPPSVVTSTIVPAPGPVKAPSPPPEDPTKKALAELAAATAQEIEAARQADHRTELLEQARLNVVAESERWRRREMLVKQQVSALADRARKIDKQIDTLAAQRDVLAKERDALKAAVTSSQQGKGSYAVLPYKGPNGSWRRPIVMECSNGTVTLRPKGPTFSMLDLSALLNPRSNPVILAIARELLHVQMSESPDGSPVVPYFVFLIRPDGIRPYYEIRARLEPLGIAFGYELIEQDLKVDVPDFDNLVTWDGTIPLDEPLMPAPAGGNNGTGDGLAWPSAGTGSKEHLGDAGNELVGRPGNKPGGGAPGTEGRSPDDFVWPSQRGARTSSSGGARPGDGQGGAESEAGSDPSLKPWPFPNQGVDQGSSNPAGGEGAADSEPDARSRRGSSGSGTGLQGAGRGRGGALLPDLEPAGNVSGSFDPGGLAGVLSATASGAPGPNGSPLLNGPGGSAGGASSAQPGATGTGANLAGTGDTISPRPPATGDLPPPGSPANPRMPGLKPGLKPDTNTSTNANSSSMAQDGSAGSASGSGPAGGLQSGARLDSSLGSQGSTSSTSSKNASAGSGSAGDLQAGAGLSSTFGSQGSASTSGSTSSSMNPSTGTLGSSLASMAGSSAPSTSSASGLVFGPDAGSTSNQTKSPSDAPRFKSRIPDGPSKTIEVPFEIVVVCRPDGAVIHPGGYLLTSKSLAGGKKDNIVVHELLAVAQRRAESDPTIRPQPRVKFLVENGGSETFWAARKQILFSGLGWPMSLQVAGGQDPHMLGKETW